MKHAAIIFALLATVYMFMSCTSNKSINPPVPPSPTATPIPPATPTPPATSPSPVSGSISEIKAIAAASKCASYDWIDRGHAPAGFIKGVAMVYARAVCNPTRDDVVLVSQANSGDDVHDVISWYNSNFAKNGMSNDKAGMDVVRHTYTLLFGLGMQESSGQYCCGRDMSADFSSSDSAEAGTFQTSWGAHRVAPALLTAMFNKYKADKSGCMLSVFQEGVGSSCGSTNAKNWGSGDGYDWQATTKLCPAFSAEFAAVLLRKTGGTLGEFGTTRHKAVELRPECDAMLKQVQDLVAAKPGICSQL